MFSQRLDVFDMSLGVTVFSLDTKSSSNVGVNMGITIDNFYCDLSGNMSTGKGEYLDFSSSNTYSANKSNVSIFNVGYNIFILQSKNWSITPIIGLGWISDIYQDPIGWETYFYGDTETYFNFGFISKIYIDKVGVFAGMGILEKFKFGLSYSFL
jgi:hypothetical protein